MANKVKKSRKTKTVKPETKQNIASLLLKQLIAAAICLLIVLGMKHSGNFKLSEYARSFGRAIRYETNWSQNATDAYGRIKDKINSTKDGVFTQ